MFIEQLAKNEAIPTKKRSECEQRITKEGVSVVRQKRLWDYPNHVPTALCVSENEKTDLWLRVFIFFLTSRMEARRLEGSKA